MTAIYIIEWTTDDTDRCYGIRDLHDLIEELGFRLEDNEIMDGDKWAGSVRVDGIG
jgi:hypothetical protein